MTTCEWIRRLDDESVAGDEAVRRHLDGCPECREELTSVERLRARAAALPHERRVPPRIWSGIERRIAAPSRRQWSLAFAATLAAGIAIGVMITRRPAPMPAPTPTSSTWGDVAAVEASFRIPRGILLDRIAERRGSLSPEVAAAVDDALATIDRAIDEILAAMEKDPESRDLLFRLVELRRSELDLLTRASRL